MRFIVAVIIGTALALAWGAPVSASEGSAFLSSDRTDVRCFVASVLLDVERYGVVMSCRNLIIPPSADRLFYKAWVRRLTAEEGGERRAPFEHLIRSEYELLGDLSNGKISAQTRMPFREVIVTSEAEESPNSPSLDRVVAVGTIRPLEFGLSPTETQGGPVVTVSTPTPVATPTIAAKAARAQTQGVIGTAIRVFLAVIGVIVVVAIVISVIQRRSASS